MKSYNYIVTLSIAIMLYVSGCSQTVVRPGAEFISKPEKIGNSTNPGVISYPDKQVLVQGEGVFNMSTKDKVESKRIAVKLASESCNGNYKIVREDKTTEDVCITVINNDSCMFGDCPCVETQSFTTNEIYYECNEGTVAKEVPSVPYVRSEDTMIGAAIGAAMKDLN